MTAFDFVSSDEFRACLARDSNELVACMGAGAWKAAHVIAGSLIQAVLVHYLIASGKAGEEEAFELTFPQLLDRCRAEGLISARTFDLASFIRPYGDFLSPSPRIRLQPAADETSARIAQALLEIVINEITSHQREYYHYTAEQVVAKLHSDPSSTAILPHLVGKISRVELERLLLELLPAAYLELARQPDPESQEALERLGTCYRVAADLAPVEVRKALARRYVAVLENESEYVVQCYQTAFFRGFDLAFLDERERGLVKTHFLTGLEKRVHGPLLNAATGFGEFLSDEAEARAFFVPLALQRIDEAGTLQAAAIEKRFQAEYFLLAPPLQRVIEGWLGRLRWSLDREGRTSAAADIEPLLAALKTPSSSS